MIQTWSLIPEQRQKSCYFDSNIPLLASLQGPQLKIYKLKYGS